MAILEHQRKAYEEIVNRARAYYAGRWQSLGPLGLQCRWHTLMTGGTGTGKSTVANLAAMACDAVPLRIATGGYIPSGAHNRATRETITVIAEHVAKNPRTFLVYDEVCKLNSGVGGGAGTADNWQTYVRGELLEITDGRWPTGLHLPDMDGPDLTIEELTAKLRTTVFILGVGTFQAALDTTTRRTIGFPGVTDDAESTDAIDNNTVVGYLGRELGNRFHSELVRLPELRAADYHRIARETESNLPEKMRGAFRREVETRIAAAITNKKAVRFIEEALTATIMQMPTPAPSNHLSLDDL